jgi:hypothetical protein
MRVFLLLLCGCGSAATGDTTATITSLGANATHDHYSGDAAQGDWQASAPGSGTLTAVSTNLEQALSLVLAGPTPTAGATYALDGMSSAIKYGDSPGQGSTRVWISVGGVARVDAIMALASDHSKTLHVSFSNVTAQPAADANRNTATGNLSLQGAALIEGVYLP